MTPISSQIPLLKSLLNKFLEVLYVSETEIEKIEEYILSEEVTIILSTEDSELYETVVYLRDLAQESHYTTIQELYNYFENQVKNWLNHYLLIKI
jgi:hypothetical protein